MQKAHLAIVNLSYKGLLRPFTVYEDGTAISADGITIQLTKEVMDTILYKKEELAQVPATSDEDKETVYEEGSNDETADENWESDMPVEPDEADVPVQYRAGKRKRTTSPRRKLNGPAKILALTAVYLVVIGGSLFGVKYILDNYLNEVAVVQLSQQTAKDAELTSDNLQPLTMSESSFKKLQSSTEGKVILWSDKDSCVGKYAAYDAMKGQYLTDRYLSKDHVITNPWLTALGSDTELYTIPFAAENVYSQILYAGSHVRMRFVVTETDQRGNVIGTTIQNDDTPETEKKITDTTPIPAPDVSTSSAPEGWVKDSKDAGLEQGEEVTGRDVDRQVESASSEVSSEVSTEKPAEEPVKENMVPAEPEKTDVLPSDITASPDLFSDLIVVDLINGNGESIYNLYLGLARMTQEERTTYLEEKAKLESADAYFNKFRANSFVFALNGKQVSEMAKLEKMENISIKYTVLPSTTYNATDEQRSLLFTFAEIQDQVASIYGNIEKKPKN